LQTHTGATGVQIGYLQHPEVPIQDDADDTDHLNKEAEKIIKVKYASKDHAFCVGAQLTPEQGVTHGVFALEQPASFGDRVVIDTIDGEEVERIVKCDILDSYKHIHIPEVVREKKMHYQRVPRLGSYLAVPMTYNHCLVDSALNEAVNDYKDVMARRDELDREKKNHEEDQAARKAEAVANEQNYEEEEREWPEIGFNDYPTTQEKFVVCLDTMG
jgi:cation transport regulator ChaB